ncbi:MAG TPA: hypothetical protein VD907_02945 [Verrucomicrobiae bacterium]|nr:hypothetical protein [Verrucomicrobiae bacterium]
MNHSDKIILSKTVISTWKRILLPNSHDYDDCVAAFEQQYGIKIPPFPERCLTVKTQNTSYIRVRSNSIPMLIDKGYADAGLVFSDVIEEYENASALTYQQLAGPELNFCLLIPEEKEATLLQRLYSSAAPPLVVATAYPRFLQKCLKQIEQNGKKLNVVLSDLPVYGAVEAMCELGVADVVADVVKTGASARANKLLIISLDKIHPTLLYKT